MTLIVASQFLGGNSFAKGELYHSEGLFIEKR